MSEEPHRLSKSRFVCGLQCHRQLWWRVHEPDAPELQPAPELQAVFDRGTRVGEVAQTHVPGGELIGFEHHEVEQKLAATREALDRGVPVIYEAAFREDGVFVAVDILERVAGGFVLIEVKSTAGVKPQHLHDAAVQTHVLRKAGLDVVRAELMHLNRECRYPDLSDLFLRQDVTEAVEAFLPSVPGEIAAQQSMLGRPLPEVDPGDQCHSPYQCPFWKRCWPERPEHHVSTLYRARHRGAELVAQGFETIFDLPEDLELGAIAARQLRSVQQGEIVVEPGLAQALAELEPPLAFLDFETVALPIPVWDGCRPYDPVPVQFSCHVQQGDGEPVHREFLAEGPGDPRPVLARAMLEACRGARSVLTYNISFERSRIRELAASLPQLADELEELVQRLADLLPIVRNHVYHPDFGGSFSIKRVLPALVPDLSYQGLDIADGEAASVSLERLLFEGGSMETAGRDSLRRALLDYCRMDTLAMVRLFARLRELAGIRT